MHLRQRFGAQEPTLNYTQTNGVNICLSDCCGRFDVRQMRMKKKSMLIIYLLVFNGRENENGSENYAPCLALHSRNLQMWRVKKNGSNKYKAVELCMWCDAVAFLLDIHSNFADAGNIEANWRCEPIHDDVCF